MRPAQRAGFLLLARFLACLACSCAYVVAVAARPVDDAVHPGTELSCALAASDPQGFRDFAACEAKRLGLPQQVATAVMEIESGFNPSARGAAGEVGLMQVMPPTALMLGLKKDDELANPAVNIRLGVRYLAKAHRLAGGDLCTTVMKYRAGHGESRFSHRSVAYCLRARKILQRDGHAVSGVVPVATFGFANAFSGPRGDKVLTGKCVRRIFVPGPRFRSCAAFRGVKVTRHTVNDSGRVQR